MLGIRIHAAFAHFFNIHGCPKQRSFKTFAKKSSESFYIGIMKQLRKSQHLAMKGITLKELVVQACKAMLIVSFALRHDTDLGRKPV